MKWFNYVALMLIVLCSCSNKRTLLLPTKEITFECDGSTLNGIPIELEVFGMDLVYVWDSLLIITTSDPEGMLKIYEKSTLEPIANLAYRGRAENEFITLGSKSRQMYMRNNELIIPFIDNDVLKEVNIHQSIKQGRTVISSVTECLPIPDGSFVILNQNVNNRFEYVTSHPDNIMPEKINPSEYMLLDIEGEKNKTIKVFNKMMDCKDRADVMSYYNATLYKHPNRNLVIQPFPLMDYILYFDLDSKNHYAVHQSGTLSFDDYAPSITMDTKAHFSSCVCAEDYFLILYFANRTDNNQGPELLAFDWDGNFIAGSRLSDYCLNIAYDSAEQKLYGVNPFRETLYEFDLKSFITK